MYANFILSGILIVLTLPPQFSINKFFSPHDVIKFFKRSKNISILIVLILLILLNFYWVYMALHQAIEILSKSKDYHSLYVLLVFSFFASIIIALCKIGETYLEFINVQ